MSTGNLSAVNSTSERLPAMPVLPSQASSNPNSNSNSKTSARNPKLGYNLDSRAEQLKTVIDQQELRIQSLKHCLAAFVPAPAPAPASLHTHHHRLGLMSGPSDPPQPAPSCPLEPASAHAPAPQNTVPPGGGSPAMDEFVPWPQRGAKHRVSFLLNPTMNPAKENFRDLTPPTPDSPTTRDSAAPLNELDGAHSTGPARSDWFVMHHQSSKRVLEDDLNSTRKRQADQHPASSSIPTMDSRRPQIRDGSENYNSHLYHPHLTTANQKLNRTHGTVANSGSGSRLWIAAPRNPSLPVPPPPIMGSRHSNDSYSDDLKSNDLIGSGKISAEDAQIYWNVFFRHYSNRLTWSHQDTDDLDSVRSASDLVLASILSVSAKVLGHHEISMLCIDEAKTLTRCTMFPVRHHNVQDLKGIMALAIYHGVHSICAHFVTLCLTLKLHKVFVKLTDRNLRGTAAEEELVEKGRTWLMVVIYSHVFCVFSNKMYLVCSPQKVITDHAKILLSSKCAKEGDRLIQAHVELVTVLASAQDKLDSRRYPGPLSKRREQYVVPELSGVLRDLEDWTKYWKAEAPELFVTDDGRPGGYAKRLRNPQQYVYLFIMHAAVWPCQDGQIIIEDEWRYHLAIEGCKCAAGILSAALSAREERESSLTPPSAVEPELPIQVEYEKVTFGLATGYLLWICQVIPGYVQLAQYRALIERLHAIDFKSCCEYHEIIKSAMRRIDDLLELRSEKTSVIEDTVAQDLNRLMTDTRFWFQVDVDREFRS